MYFFKFFVEIATLTKWQDKAKKVVIAHHQFEYCIKLDDKEEKK